MIKVDTKVIDYNTNDNDNFIKKYIDNNNEFYNDLSKLSSYWKGYDFDAFSRKMLKQRENDMIISEELSKFNNVYKDIKYIYEEE